MPGSRRKSRKRNKSSPLVETSPKKPKSQGTGVKTDSTAVAETVHEIASESDTDSVIVSQSLLKTLCDTVDPVTVDLPSTPSTPSTPSSPKMHESDFSQQSQQSQDQPGLGPGVGFVPQPPIMNPALGLGVHPQMVGFSSATPGPGLSEFDIIRIAQLVKSMLQQEISDQVQSKVSEVSESLKSELVSTKSDLESLKEQCSSLQNEVIVLQKKQDEAEQYSRRMCLRISGIAETSNEDVTKKVLDFAKTVKSNITALDIDRAHRVGPPKSDTSVNDDNVNDGDGVIGGEVVNTARSARSVPKSREIIIKFTNSSARRNLLQGRIALRDQNIKNVYINEDLTPARNQLAFECRRIQRIQTSKINKTWIFAGYPHILDSDGNKIKITCMSDLKVYDVK